MDKFKKIKTKIFKSKQPKDKPLFLPVRPSYETEEVVLYGSPPAANYIHVKPEERYPDWFPCKPDPNDFSRPYFPRRPYVEKKIVDQFPTPPTTIPVKPLPPVVKPVPKRPSVRPPSMDFCDVTPPKLPPKRPSVRPPTLDFSEVPKDVHPKYPQQTKARMDTFDAAAAARNAARLRARQRTPSSVSGQTQQTQPLNVRRRNVSTSNAPVQPSGGMYKNYAAAQSMRNINPQTHYHAYLANQRQTGDADSDSSGSIYSCSSAARSAHDLPPDTRYRAFNSTSTPAVPPLPSQHNYEREGAAVCRQNASSASSRSVHAMRRHGMLPPPVGSHAHDHEVLRILRGPHATKLETPYVPSRANEEIGLRVNDTKSSKAWGAKSSRAPGGVATVAGYGHSAGARRY